MLRYWFVLGILIYNPLHFPRVWMQVGWFMFGFGIFLCVLALIIKSLR